MTPSSATADRFPVLLRETLAGDPPGPRDLVLLDADLDLLAPPGAAVHRIAFAAGHVPRCACCGPTPPLARALLALLGARARGEVAFFDRVLAVSDGPGLARLSSLLRENPLVAARYVAEARSEGPAPAA
jgi:hypothetical protein